MYIPVCICHIFRCASRPTAKTSPRTRPSSSTSHGRRSTQSTRQRCRRPGASSQCTEALSALVLCSTGCSRASLAEAHTMHAHDAMHTMQRTRCTHTMHAHDARTRCTHTMQRTRCNAHDATHTPSHVHMRISPCARACAPPRVHARNAPTAARNGAGAALATPPLRRRATSARRASAAWRLPQSRAPCRSRCRPTGSSFRAAAGPS